jgi:tetraprenyl-beta-curcumene synthase
MIQAFSSSASRYWLTVFPDVNREVRAWRMRAAGIPDPELRRLALLTHRNERGNLEGAAAFAVLVPSEHRATVIRAAVAFQALYDFVDTLAEAPNHDPLANGHQLHLALLAALDPSIDCGDYYHYSTSPQGADGAYLLSMIAACRAACAALPSYDVARLPALRAARRMVSYQAYIHARQQPERDSELARWATSITPPGEDLRWWEVAAGAASSLGVFALMATAAQTSFGVEEMAVLEHAYFPWIGALHVLLDSLADRSADIASGHLSLVSHYEDTSAQAERLARLADRAVSAASAVPQATHHLAILSAMTSFYLSAPGARKDSSAALASERVLAEIGGLAAPAMTVLRARRAAGKALASARTLSIAAAR